MQNSASKKADTTAIAQNQPSASSLPTLQVQEADFSTKAPKALHVRLEGLKTLNHKKEILDDFTKRLENVVVFKEKNVNKTLHLTISSGEEELSFSNPALIMTFLEEAIKEGKIYKEKAEMEFLNIEL